MQAPGQCPSVELAATDGDAEMVSYRLEVVTSDLRGASTDSSVWVEIHGAQVGSGPRCCAGVG